MRKASVVASRYWRHGWIATVVLLALLVVRLPELLPLIGKLNLVIVSLPILTLLYLANTGNRALHSVAGDTLLRLMICYAAWAFVTAPFAMWPSKTLSMAAQTFPIGLFLMTAILLSAPSRRNLDRMLAGFVLCTAALSGLLLAQSVVGGDNRLGTWGMYDPNDLGALLAATFAIAAHYVIVSRGRKRILYAAAVVALATGLVHTASRGGLVAIVVGTVVLLAALNLRRTVTYVTAVAIAGFMLWYKGPPVFRERAASLLTVREDYNMTDPTGRIQLWTRGISYALEQPLTGLGMNNFPLAEGEYFERSSLREIWRPAHNSYIQAFAELGVVGGVLLLAMLGVGIRRAASLWRSNAPLHRPDLLAALLAFCTSAMFLSHAYSYLMFALLAFVAFAGRVDRSETAAFAVTRAPLPSPGRTDTPRAAGPQPHPHDGGVPPEGTTPLCA